MSEWNIVEIEIFFDDLKEETQKEILEKLQIKHPKELNWDVVPMDIIQIDLNEIQEELEEEMLAEAAADEPIVQGTEDPAGLFDNVEEEE